MKLADNLSRHKISHVFKILPEWTIYFGVALIAEKTIFDLLCMLVSGERLLPFGRLVCVRVRNNVTILAHKITSFLRKIGSKCVEKSRI